MTQAALILRELEAAPAQWVAMPRLAHISGAFAVHSRVADLRAAGHTIENRTARDPHSGRRLSFYRLLPPVPVHQLPLPIS